MNGVDVHAVVQRARCMRHHDSRWSLIEVAVTSAAPMRIGREDITLVTPGWCRSLVVETDTVSARLPIDLK